MTNPGPEPKTLDEMNRLAAAMHVGNPIGVLAGRRLLDYAIYLTQIEIENRARDPRRAESLKRRQARLRTLQDLEGRV